MLTQAKGTAFSLFWLARSTATLLREATEPHGFLLAVGHMFPLAQIVNAWDVLIID